MNLLPDSLAGVDYGDSVCRFLSIGEPPEDAEKDWLDYVADYALGPQHIADLSRMAGDAALYFFEERDPGFGRPSMPGERWVRCALKRRCRP